MHATATNNAATTVSAQVSAPLLFPICNLNMFRRNERVLFHSVTTNVTLIVKLIGNVAT